MRDIFTMPALVALALSIGCGSGAGPESPESAADSGEPSYRPSWTETDSWYTPPPEWGYENWPLLDSSFVHLVVHSMEADAERVLSDTPVAELTQNEAERYLAKSVTLEDGQSLYLVRGIYLDPYGRFIVSTNEEGWVSVFHGSLGKRPLPMKRQTLVLQLKEAPTRVFVTCHMAE